MYPPSSPLTPSSEPQPQPTQAAPLVPGAAPYSDAPTSWTPANVMTPGGNAVPASAYVASPAAATYAASPAPQPGRRSVGPGFVMSAVLASALLASGGTYVLVNSTDHSTAGSPAAATGTQAPATGGTSTNGGATAGGGNSTGGTTAGGSTGVADIFKAVSPAVVTIVADGVTLTDPSTGQSGEGTATGSGVIFDSNGLILTNHHVVEGNPQKLTVNLKDGRSFDGTIYGVDTLTDLAIVKVNETGLPTAPIGDSSTIQVGQEAIAIGSPLGTFTDPVTSGIISAIGRSIPVESGDVLTNLIQTDTAINPGNSGGPLLDPSGKVIGINTAGASSSQGIGFAIPINIARPLLAQASAGQPLARPYLGIRYETINPTIKKDNNLPVANGAWIPTADAASNQGSNGGSNGQGGQGLSPGAQGQTGGTVPTGDVIVPGGPAAQAGLQAGDIITAVDGTTLDATHPLDLVTSQLAPGAKVTLDILRNGQATKVTVTLGTRPSTM